MYQQSQKGASAGKVAEKDVKNLGETAKGIAKDPEKAAKNAVN